MLLGITIYGQLSSFLKLSEEWNTEQIFILVIYVSFKLLY